MEGLFLIDIRDSDSGKKQCIIKFEDEQQLNKYIKNNPLINLKEFVVIEGSVTHNLGVHIYDGRFQ